MELPAEKKRLAQELEELQGEYDDIKPLTPTGTRDWYVKWGSMMLGGVSCLPNISRDISFWTNSLLNQRNRMGIRWYAVG